MLHFSAAASAWHSCLVGRVRSSCHVVSDSSFSWPMQGKEYHEQLDHVMRVALAASAPKVVHIR